MIDWLQLIDTSVFLTLNGMHTEFFDHFMMLATGRFTWVPFYVALAVMLWLKFGVKRALLLLLMVALLITLADQICSSLLRPMIQRLRPAHPDNPLAPMVTLVNGYRGGHYGFPSSHGANSFALALFLSLVYRRRLLTWTIYVWALLHVYTRIYLGVHYVGDILAGALLGSLIAVALYYLYNWVREKVPAQQSELGKRLGFDPAWIPLAVLIIEAGVISVLST